MTKSKSGQSVQPDRNTEQAILEAAEREFLAKGFESAKTTEIAAAAGVTHAMLHYYFRSKENLFNRIFERTLQSMLEYVFEVFEMGDMPLAERVGRFVEVHFDYMIANPRAPRFIINELINKPDRISLIGERMTARSVELLSKLDTMIDQEVKAGTIRPISSIDLLLDIVSVNVFVFIALPIAEAFERTPYASLTEFLQLRKRECVNMILSRLTYGYGEKTDKLSER